MPALSASDLAAVARLARLRLEGDARDRLLGDLARILDYVSALERIDVGGVEPTAHVLELTGGGRADEPQACLDRDALLGAAPDAAAGHVRVPRVLG